MLYWKVNPVDEICEGYPSVERRHIELVARAIKADQPAALHKEGPLSEEDLAALDSLRETHPNLWRHIRECGQAVLLLHKEGAGGVSLTKEQVRQALTMCPGYVGTLSDADFNFVAEYLNGVAASPAGRAEQR